MTPDPSAPVQTPEAPTSPPVIAPYGAEELDDIEACLAESPSLDGQRWFGVWTPTVERLFHTVRALQQELRGRSA